MCQHSSRSIGRQLIGLDLNDDGRYSVTIMSWIAASTRRPMTSTYEGLTLPEAMQVIDASSAGWFADPF